MLISMLLIPTGFLVGLMGSLLGVGGGFILLPILLLLYPDMKPRSITAVSMAVVFINSISGTHSYWKMKRIDVKSGLLFSMVTIPCALMGTHLSTNINRRNFNIVFGAVMLGLCIYMLTNKSKESESHKQAKKGSVIRSFTDQNGVNHKYTFSLGAGLAISCVAGLFSGFLGIGGGVIHVPALIFILNFPAHIATATSQFIVLFSTFAGLTIHILHGSLMPRISEVVFLTIGILAGSPFGARISGHMNQRQLVRFFAVVAGIIGIRILVDIF